MIQDAVLRNLEITGEAAKNFSTEFRLAHPEIGWRAALHLRNVLIHSYMGVNLHRVWSTVTKQIVQLKKQIVQIQSVTDTAAE